MKKAKPAAVAIRKPTEELIHIRDETLIPEEFILRAERKYITSIISSIIIISFSEMSLCVSPPVICCYERLVGSEQTKEETTRSIVNQIRLFAQKVDPTKKSRGVKEVWLREASMFVSRSVE